MSTLNWLKNYEVFLRKNVLLDKISYEVEVASDNGVSMNLLDKPVTIYFQE